MISRLFAHLAVLSTCILTTACPGDGGGDTEATTDDSTGAPTTGTGSPSEPTASAPTTVDPTTTGPTTGPGPTTATTDPGPTTATTGPDETTDPGDTSTVTTDDPDTGDTSTGTTSPVDPDTDTGTSSDTGVVDTDTDTDDSSTGEPSPWDGEPLPPAPEGEWTWIDFPDAKCRDGSSTGIGVRYGSGAGLVIYFQSGGACFNAETCNQNAANFGPTKFANFMAQNGTKGVFDPENPANPVGDWSYVFVPYCTGDVHAGAQPDGQLQDVPQVQQFVGYLNVGHYLERVVPTFIASADHVLVTGESAGGFGSLFNYDRIATAFPDRPVTLVDDSGPLLPDSVMTSCLQTLWRTVWNLDQNLPQDCSSCFPQDGGGLINVIPYLGAKYPDQSLGIISSQSDATITYFFEFGLDACQGGDLPPGAFAAGLAELRDLWMEGDVWSTFYPAGNQHTWLLPSYFGAQIGGTKLTSWISDLLAGAGAHLSG